MIAKQSEIKTLVVKIGTTLLSGERGFDGRLLEAIVKEVSALKRERDINILIVSSGAIGCGMNILNMKERPTLLPMKQATAAIGQSRLMHYYEVLFETYGNGLKTAQLLLTSRDLDDRRAYLNVRNTLNALFAIGGVIPIINENDCVATEQLSLGDNDTLAARIAMKIDADLLIILSDVDGLFDKDPMKFREAKLLDHVDVITPEIEALAEDTSVATSVGGMKTKLAAARIASSSNIPTVIANGHTPGIVGNVLDGKRPFTSFGPSTKTISKRKRWIAFGRTARGVLLVDDGARRALVDQGKSLLPAGVVSIENRFDMGDTVIVRDAEGASIARGIVNYGSDDIDRIKGCKTTEIKDILGRKDFDEVIHRDNLVLM